MEKQGNLLGGIVNFSGTPWFFGLGLLDGPWTSILATILSLFQIFAMHGFHLENIFWKNL